MALLCSLLWGPRGWAGPVMVALAEEVLAQSLAALEGAQGLGWAGKVWIVGQGFGAVLAGPASDIA